jgi:hypothetical protein
MNRAWQTLLIATFIPLCWLMMQVVHEFGHMSVAWATGGRVEKVFLHPLTISQTLTADSAHPAAVKWGGPLVGVALPLAIWAVFKLARWKWVYLAQFFAGFCLMANGSYLAADSFVLGGDAGDLIRMGSPRWPFWLFGAIAVPLGLFLWNGLGPSFGRGEAKGIVGRRAAICSAAALAVVVIIEVMFGSPG